MLLSPQTFDGGFSLEVLNWWIIFDTSWLISDDSHRKENVAALRALHCLFATCRSCRPTFFATWLREGEQVSTRFCVLMKCPVHFRMILAILSQWSSIWCTIDGYCNSLHFLLFICLIINFSVCLQDTKTAYLLFFGAGLMGSHHFYLDRLLHGCLAVPWLGNCYGEVFCYLRCGCSFTYKESTG